MNNSKKCNNKIIFDRKLTLGNIIVLLGIALGVAGWYFTTQANTKEIEIIKREKLNREIYELQIAIINDKLDELNSKMDRILEEK